MNDVTKKKPARHDKKQETKQQKCPVCPLSMPKTFLLIFLALALVSFIFLFRVPYTARETYTELETYTEPETYIESQPVEREKCEDIAYRYAVERHETYGKYVGRDYLCYAEVTIANHERTDGKWTVSYTFEYDSSTETVDPITRTIFSQTSETYKFEYPEPCERDKELSGDYTVEDYPTNTECRMVTENEDVELTRDVVKQKPVEKQRLITKYETLWQMLIGYNRREKV